MADAKVLEFIQQVERDAALGARVRAVDTADRNQAFTALAQIAKEEGYTVSPAALEAGLAECAPRELSDDDLDAVAGGGIQPCAINLTPSSAFSSFFRPREIIPCI